MGSGPFRDAAVPIERVAALQEENEELRARVAELEESARTDERHVKIRRLEEELEKLRERTAAWRAQEAERDERTHAALRRENEALRAEAGAAKNELKRATRASAEERDEARIALRDDNEKLRGEIEKQRAEIHALRTQLKNVESKSGLTALRKQVEELTRERDAIARERDEVAARHAEAAAHVRGENEQAFITRLTEERDELLAEVRRLRERAR